MSADKKDDRFETRAVHNGEVPEDGTGSLATPIFPSSTYKMTSPGDESGYVYSRWANPTRIALEKALASLEGGTHAYAFSSGMAAIGAVTNLLKSGDHVVAVSDLYGGSHRFFEQLMKQHFGLEFDYVDGQDPEDFRRAIKANTRLFWVETPTNPLMKLIDIKAVSQIAREKGIILAVDNTFATPYIQRPLELGADLVHHSASKYLGGHADVIAGALVTRDAQLAEKLRFNQYAVGGQLGPFESWLILRGLKTLHLRVERSSHNARQIVEYLDSQEIVRKIYYPGHGGETLKNGMSLSGGMISFELDTDLEQVKKFVMSTRLFVLAESLGGVESLVNHPALMTHSSIPQEIREKHGITDNLVRLSVGVENVDDLIADLAGAFKAIGKVASRS